MYSVTYNIFWKWHEYTPLPHKKRPKNTFLHLKQGKDV